MLSSTSISGYSISSGSMTALSGSSYKLTGATAIAIAPSGDFLYVATTGGIYVYTIDTSTGALTLGSTVFPDTEAEAIQVDPSGAWLLDASATGVLLAYPVTSSGAEDTTRSTQTQTLKSGSVEPGGIAISPNGALVAVALETTGTEAFPFTASNNSAPIGSPYNKILTPYGSGGAAIAVAIDPQSRLLYVGETDAFPSSTTNSGALRVYTIGTNSLTEFTYSTPYAPTGTGPHAILPISTGSYVYVASWQSGTTGVITGYSVTTSALTQLSGTSATGTEPYGLAEDSSDSFVLAASYSGTTLSAYTIGSSGALGSPLTDSPVSNPIAIVAAP
jgi:DNA-binding beta-propeller fold protein YncE